MIFNESVLLDVTRTSWQLGAEWNPSVAGDTKIATAE